MLVLGSGCGGFAAGLEVEDCDLRVLQGLRIVWRRMNGLLLIAVQGKYVTGRGRFT